MVIIDASRAFQRYIEAGKSAGFVELMQALHDQPHYGSYRHLQGDESTAMPEAGDEIGAPGLPTPRRYRVGTLQRLERVLATRSLQTRDLRLQLCSFVAALSGTGLGSGRSWQDAHLFDLPAHGPAHPSVFANYFDEKPAPDGSVALDASGVSISAGFALRFTRMPILDAFLSMLMASEIEPEITALFDGLTAAPIDDAALKHAASALSSLVEPYLDKILRRRDDLKSFRTLVDGLRRVASEPDGALHFDDAHLLAFWRIAAPGTRFDGDWVRFETTASRVVLAAWALRAGAALIALRQEMKPIGGDRDAGEVDVRDVDGLASLMEDAGSPLDPFREGGQLAELKLINATECERLAFLLDHGRALASFAQTFLRREVFGPLQNKLTNQKRQRSRGDGQWHKLLAMEGIAGDDYQRVHDGLVVERDRLLDKLLGIYAVAQRFEPETFDSYDHLAQWFDDDALRSLELRGRQAMRAFAAMRRGRIQEAMTTHAIADLLISAIDPLVTVVARLNAMIDALERSFERQGADQLLDADKPRFAETFATLYGPAGQGQPAWP